MQKSYEIDLNEKATRANIRDLTNSLFNLETDDILMILIGLKMESHIEYTEEADDDEQDCTLDEVLKKFCLQVYGSGYKPALKRLRTDDYMPFTIEELRVFLVKYFPQFKF
jgi:hypothetical protein